MDLTEFAGTSVLVTGGAGFIGSHIADMVVDHADVRILDDLSSGSRDHVPDQATLIEGDIRDEDTVERAMDGIDFLFHEAGLVSVPESLERPMDCHEINGTATVRLLEAGRRNDSRVVIASSAAIYGHPGHVPVPEDASKDPQSPYGIEKLSADHYVQTYAAQYDLDAVALRYFNVYGPRQSGGQYSGVISAFVDQARSGGPITVEGDGEQTRDFIHVDDVVDANLRAATIDSAETAFNVGTGTSVTINELAETVRDIVDADVPITHVDPRPGDIRHSKADISRARRELDFDPTIQLADGLPTAL
ncbi:NAD-dependent epimerase/dehydratase family protein [Haloarcula amylolytica]|uniref:NAD-dependent epimerase/dehydratase family protein n=1 Tax=Haloarcula amylolytica TaxID=396317 RepID=UPI003C76E09D